MLDAALTDLRDSLQEAVRQLIAERDAAGVGTAQAAAAQAESERLLVILNNVQFAIDKQVALNMNAVAARLLDSVQRQQAAGLSQAAATLNGIIGRISPAPPAAPSPAPGQGESAPLPTGTGEIQARPGPHLAIINQLIAGAITENLDPITVLTIVHIEDSRFDPTATNPRSSAGGLFQFLDSTWQGEGGQTFPGRGGNGNGHAAAAPVSDQIRIGCRFIAKNVTALRTTLRAEPRLGNTYMAHQQGLGGARRILEADRNAPIELVISVDQARNNGLAGKTVDQVIAKFDFLVRSHEDEVRSMVVEIPATGTPGTPVAEPVPLSFGTKAAHTALLEMETFARRGNTIVTETEPPLRQRVLAYFALVGRRDIQDPAAEPWSAAFISFVMSQSGASLTQFPISPSHHRYILAGLRNRINNNLNASIVYFDKNEVAPRIGDLIGFSRTADVKNRSDIEHHLPDRFFRSHTDLVIDTSPGRINVIGGNVSQTIKTAIIRSNAEDKIDPADEHFFVLRINL